MMRYEPPDEGRPWQRMPLAALSPEAASQGSAGGESLLDFWDIFRRRKWLILGLTALGTFLGLAISIPKPIVYSAKATLEVQVFNENFMGMGQMDPQAGSLTPTESNINTQMAILRSNTIRNQVISRLQRETIPSVPPNPPGYFYTLRRHVLTLLRRATSQDPLDAMREGLVVASSTLSVKSVKGTRIIEIGCESTDPYLASSFVNTLADEFIEQSLGARLQSLQRASKWMSTQLEDLKTRLESSERELQSYVSKSMGGSERAGERDVLVQSMLQQMQREMGAVQTDRMQKEGLFNAASKATPEELASAPEGPAVKPLVTRLGELRNQLAELSLSMTPAHYRVKQLQGQIGDTEAAIQRERNIILTNLKRQVDEARNKEALVQAVYTNEMKGLGVGAEKLMQYSLLKRQLETNRQLYQTMLQNVNVAGLASAAPASNLRMIDRAEANLKPDDLRGWIMNVCLGLVTGLVLAVILSTALHKTRQRVKFPGDASSLLRLRELGVIPSSSMAVSRSGRWLGRRAKRPGFPASSEDGLSPSNGASGKLELAAWSDGPSWLAESFRSTLASLVDPQGRYAHTQMFAVTSPGPKEGKSTVACNLAIALAETHRRVLLVDGDMRAPRLHRIFDLSNDWGLKEAVDEQTPIDQYDLSVLGHPTEVPGLFLLPGGRSSAKLGSLFYSKRLRVLFERLRREFDHIIIDTPPVLAFADARLIGQLCDGVVLVLRSDKTLLPDTIEAFQMLQRDGVVVLGSILNDWDFRGSSRTSYASYYHKYYAAAHESDH